MGQTAVLRTTPALDDLVELPAGRYVLGEPGEEREVELARVLIGRYAVCHAHVHGPDAQLADHPATNVSLAEGTRETTRRAVLTCARAAVPSSLRIPRR